MAESLAAFGFSSWSKCVTVIWSPVALQFLKCVRLRSRGLNGCICLRACGMSDPMGPQVSVFAGPEAEPLVVTAMLEAPRPVTSFLCVLLEPLSRGFSRLQRTRKVQTRMHVACFGGPHLADSQIQLKNKPTHHFGPCFKKKIEKKNLHFFCGAHFAFWSWFFFPFESPIMHSVCPSL